MFECLFQCDNKEHFIERIKEMDLEVQKSLVEYIQQVIDFSSFHYNWSSFVGLILYFKMKTCLCIREPRGYIEKKKHFNTGLMGKGRG